MNCNFRRLARPALLIGMSLVMVAQGCTSAASISPSTTPITSNDTYTVIGAAQGTAYGFWILFLPFPAQYMGGTAKRRAIDSVGADALIECCDETKFFTMFLLFTISWTKCKGTAIKIKHGGNLIAD